MKESKEQDVESLENKVEKIKIVNKYLKKKLEIYQKYILLTKDIMSKCLSAENNSSYDIFNTYINEIQKDNDFLKDDYEKKYYPKYQSLLDECFNDLSMGKPVLEQCQNEEFSLDYLKIKSEDIITGLKKSIKQSKEFHLFREPKRDVLIDFKKGDKEIVKTTTELQQNMLYECKKCNKFCNRIEKYNNQIKIINKNIEILKKYLNNENSKNQNDNISIKNTDNNTNIPDIKEDKNIQQKLTFKMEKDNLKQSINLGFFPSGNFQKNNNEEDKNNNDTDRRGVSSDRKKRRKSGVIALKRSIKRQVPIKKKRNKIISEFKTVEELFDISNEEGEKEKIIDDELHSDDESVFANKIKQTIQLSVKYLDNVKKTIPNINLKQIEYNKLKIVGEADLYSLERRKYKSQNINANIKELKKKIEKMTDKLNVIQQKEKVMKDYIDKIQDNYDSLKPIVAQSSVYKKRVSFIKKSLFGGENIKEELGEDEDEKDMEYGSDYNNEEKEDSEIEIEKKFNFKDNFKRSVFIGRIGEQNNGAKLKHSVQDGIFKNRLRKKLKNRERANSK